MTQAQLNAITREVVRLRNLVERYRLDQNRPLPPLPAPNSTRHRKRSIAYVRLKEHLMPGGQALGVLVSWNTGRECWQQLGSCPVVVKDSLCVTLACRCDVVPVTQQFGNQFHTYTDRTGPFEAVAIEDGSCNEMVRFAIGPTDLLQQCICGMEESDSCGSIGSGSDLNENDPYQIASTTSDLFCYDSDGNCVNNTPLYVSALYQGNVPVQRGDRVWIWVDRKSWFRKMLSRGERCRLIAIEGCGNICDDSSASDDECVIFESMERCLENGKIEFYKRAVPLVMVNGRITCGIPGDWILSSTCGCCCDSESSSESASSCEPRCCVEYCNSGVGNGSGPCGPNCGTNGFTNTTVTVDSMGVVCVGDEVTVTMVVANHSGGIDPVIDAISVPFGPCGGDIVWEVVGATGPGTHVFNTSSVTFVGGTDGTYTAKFRWVSGCYSGGSCGVGDQAITVQGIGDVQSSFFHSFCISESDGCN